MVKPKRTKVVLDHVNDDFINLPHVWVSKDGIQELQDIWSASKALMQTYWSVSLMVDARTYIDFPAKNTEEESEAGDVKVEIDSSGSCRLSITNYISEAFGRFQL